MDAEGDVAVKANHHANTTEGCIVDMKAILGRRIVVLLKKAGGLRDLNHLGNTANFPLCIDHQGSIVVFPIQ